jgi:hypothetical protein
MTALEMKASDAFADRVSRNHARLKALAGQIAVLTVRAADLTGLIGGDLADWCGHEQVSFAFLHRHKAELPPDFTFERAKRIMAVSRKCKDKLKLELHARNELFDALKGLEGIFLALGLLNARGEFQRFSESAPVEKLSAKDRETIREELRWAVELSAKLQSEDRE